MGTVETVAQDMGLFLPLFDHFIALFEGLFATSTPAPEIEARFQAVKAEHARVVAALTPPAATDEAPAAPDDPAAA
jgi:hypothetical protein